MSLYKRLHEIQTPTADPTLVHPPVGPVYGPPEPGPLYGPPEPAETAPPRHTLRGLALTALGGYVMYKSAEGLNTPAEEVVQFAVMPAALAVTGLRSQVTEARLRTAERRSKRLSEKAHPAHKRAKRLQDSYERVMNGAALPYETSAEDMEKATPIDRLDRVARKIRNPRRKPQATDSYSATQNWRHARRVKKMNDKRDKRRKLQLESESKQRWFSTGQAHYSGDPGKPYETPSDLGTAVGWAGFYQNPRTGLEVRGYRRADEQSHHELHKAHKITEKAHKKVEKAETKAKRYEIKATGRRGKIAKLERRKTAITNREDRVSKIYDVSTQTVRTYTRNRADDAKQEWKEVKQDFESIRDNGLKAGIGALFQEGQAGIKVPNSADQRLLNWTARRAGRVVGARRNSKATRPTRAERKAARKQEKEEYKRQNQNGGIV